MKTFPIRKIYIGWILGILAILSAFLGMLSLWFYLPSVCFLAAFLVLAAASFKCPYCGRFINLDRLTAAINRPQFCHHCGQRITISSKIQV